MKTKRLVSSSVKNQAIPTIAKNLSIRDAWDVRREAVEFRPERRQLSALWRGQIPYSSASRIAGRLREIADGIDDRSTSVNFVRVSRGSMIHGKYAPFDAGNPAVEAVSSAREYLCIGLTDNEMRVLAHEMSDNGLFEEYPDTRGWPTHTEERLDWLQRSVQARVDDETMMSINADLAFAAAEPMPGR